MRFLRLFAIAAIAGAMVAGPAPAKSGTGVRLSVLPLPKSSLGLAARSLRLQRESGVIDNESYWASEIPLYPNRWNVSGPDPTALGRVDGYALDYGRGASGRAGITEVWTSVDEYDTSVDAAKALASWRQAETNGFLKSKDRGALSVTITKEKAAAVGTPRFAALASYRGKKIARLFGLDEQFTVDRYEADVTVWAGSAAAAKKLAPRLAKRLGARISQELAGTLLAEPVKLPSQTGSSGPDLAPLGLKATDLNGPATVTWRGDSPLRVPFSFYHVQMEPAGQFHHLDQAISWYRTANEARFNDDYEASRTGPGEVQLDLSKVGDGAWGRLYYYKQPGGIALLFFSSGKIDESIFIQGTSDNPIHAAQVENFAPIVARYIDAAGFGRS